MLYGLLGGSKLCYIFTKNKLFIAIIGRDALDIIGQFLLALIPAIIVFGFIARLQHKDRQEKDSQGRSDQHIILNLYNRVGSYDIQEYKILPTFADRLHWLQTKHPDFIAALTRQYENSRFAFIIASNFDMRLMQDNTAFEDRKAAVEKYITTAENMSITEYQVILDQSNIAYRKVQLEREATLRREVEARKPVTNHHHGSTSSVAETQTSSYDLLSMGVYAGSGVMDGGGVSCDGSGTD